MGNVKCEERIASYRCAVLAMTGYRTRIRFIQLRGTRNDRLQNINSLPGKALPVKLAPEIPGTLRICSETKPTALQTGLVFLL